MLQRLLGVAGTHFGHDAVICPHVVFCLSSTDKVVRSVIGNSHHKLISEFSRLSMTYGVVTHFGEGANTDDEPAAATWFSVKPFTAIRGVRPLGRSGGHAAAPLVRLLPADSQPRLDASASLSAMWLVK